MASIELASIFWGHKGIKSSSYAGVYEGWEYSKPNSAGGVGIKNTVYNASEKVMKYLTFTYVAYNQVGDVIKCGTTGNVEAYGKLTGPIQPNELATVTWDVLWYNPTVSNVAIKEIHIEYMDGTEETVLGSDIMNTSSKESVYYQKRGKLEEEERERRRQEEEKKKQELEEKQKRNKKLICGICIAFAIVLFLSMIIPSC